MTDLSPDDRATIAKHPLDPFLDHVREPLRETEQSYEPGSLLFDRAADSSDYDPQEAISKLLLALMGHKVAYNLRSKTGNSNVATELSKLFGLVQSGRYSYEHYRALSRLVVKKAPDVGVWNAVFDLITTVSRTTPPTSIPPSFDGTPVTISSSSQQGDELAQLCHADLALIIRKNGRYYTYCSIDHNQWPPPMTEIKKSYPLPVNLLPQDLDNRNYDSQPKSEEEPPQTVPELAGAKTSKET